MPSSDRTRRHALSARSIVHPRSDSRPALSGRSRTRSGSSREPRRRRLLEFRVGLYSQRFDRDELFRPAVLNVFELVAFAKVRFRSRLRIIGRLGQQRDVVLLDDAEPHAVAIELTLLAYGDPAGSGTSEVIFMASRVWSLCGAPWLQPTAINGNSAGPRNRKNKRNPLPPAAAGCLRGSMVSRASAVGCHPLREVPSLRGRRSISLKRQVLRTRRPTGLDGATLARRCVEVKQAREIASLSCVRPPAPRAALVTRAEATKADRKSTRLNSSHMSIS